MEYSKIIGFSESVSKIPVGSTIGMPGKTFLIDNNDDIVVPTGDTYWIGNPLYKVKLIEEHANLHKDNKYKNYPIFAERNCILIKGKLYTYSLMVHHQLWSGLFGFPIQIQKIKELTDNGSREHSTLLSYYLENLISIINEDDVEIVADVLDLIEQYRYTSSHLIDGMSLIDHNVLANIHRCTYSTLSSLSNLYHQQYANMYLDDIIYPHILGRNTIDRFTLGYMHKPMSIDKLKMYYQPTKALNLADLDPVDVDSTRIIPMSHPLATEIYDTINYSGLTDINLRYILSKRDDISRVLHVKYCGNRFLRKDLSDKVSKVVIKNLSKLFHKLIYDNIDEVEVIKTFSDDVQIRYFKNSKLVDSWYWDSALSALCSNNLIVWPEA